jgi:LacI family transcriptional regulator
MDKVTIADIAKTAGVSRSTVSRVITNNPNVKPDTREKIQSIIDSYKYKPSSLARGLAVGKINVIALIIGDIRNPFYSEMVWMVENILTESGYMVVLCDSGYDIEKEVSYLQTVKQLGFSGVILASAMESNDLTAILKTMDCPILLINRYIKSFECDSVLLDNFQGGYIAARHLIELGHTKIGILAGPVKSTSSLERLEGCKQALQNFQIEYREDFVVNGNLTIEDGYEYGVNLIKSEGDKPTAVFAGNDLMAIGIMEACNEHGLRIPEELSIIGFDDIPYASINKITTVKQPLHDMANMVANRILKKIQEDNSENRKFIFTPQLIVRNTTKRLED